MPKPVVTRFAPSPTGHLHVGGARTALFNWAFARRHGGKFILRIEDTDEARSTTEATRRIIQDMKWLGLEWDEGPDPDKPYEAQKGQQKSYFQSQRGEIYWQYLQKLIASGRAFEDKGAYRFKMPGKEITVHDQVLGDVTIQKEQLEDFIIFKSPREGEATGGPTFHFANVVDDLTMGVTHVLRAQEHLMNTPKHLALFEALGAEPPLYAHMPLIFNPDGSKMSKRDKAKAARTAAQAWLKEHKETDEAFALNVYDLWKKPLDPDDPVAPPQGAAVAPTRELSVPLIAEFMAKKNDDPDVAEAVARHMTALLGVKHEVRLPEIDVQDFRKSGYLPEVLLNYVALLGWSPGQNVEHFDLSYLKAEFDLERIGKSPAKFDRQKLLAFNAERLSKLTPEDFAARLAQHIHDYHGWLDEWSRDKVRFARFAECYRPRAKTLDDPVSAGRFFAMPDAEIKFDPKAVEKVLKSNDGRGKKTLDQLGRFLYKLEDWSPHAIHVAIEEFAKSAGLQMGDVAQPLRVAVAGTTVSPAIHDTLAILGKESTLQRIDRCLVEAN